MRNENLDDFKKIFPIYNESPRMDIGYGNEIYTRAVFENSMKT